jgi:hypothetical protein
LPAEIASRLAQLGPEQLVIAGCFAVSEQTVSDLFECFEHISSSVLDDGAIDMNEFAQVPRPRLLAGRQGTLIPDVVRL